MGLVHLTADLVSQTPALDPLFGDEDGYIYTFESLGIPGTGYAPFTSFPDSTHLIGPRSGIVGYQYGYTFSGSVYDRAVGAGPINDGSDHNEFHVLATSGWFDASAADYYDGAQTIGLLHLDFAPFSFTLPDGPNVWWFWDDLSGRDLTMHVYYYVAGRSPLRRLPVDNGAHGPRRLYPPPKDRRAAGGYH